MSSHKRNSFKFKTVFAKIVSSRVPPFSFSLPLFLVYNFIKSRFWFVDFLSEILTKKFKTLSCDYSLNAIMNVATIKNKHNFLHIPLL